MNHHLSRLITLSSTVLLLACGGDGSKYPTVTANHSGAVTRAHWQAERRPVVIETDTILSECIGVSMLLRDATSDEISALSSARFERKGTIYRANDFNALTSDTTALTGICFPVFRGTKASSAVELKAPFTENLYGKEVGRTFGSETKIRYKWCSGMALLRIFTESDDVRDQLDRLTIGGDYIYNSGLYMPYTGEWCQKVSEWSIDAPDAGCKLNNGRNHDFFLIPSDTACAISIRATINGRDRILQRTIPPMHAGSLTELHLKASKTDFVVSSSWVDSKRKLYIQDKKNIAMDSIKVGYFLRSDGYITTAMDAKSIAIVCETDGKHGKAVAINDCKGRFVFSSSELPAGKNFETIDGKRHEGILNPSPQDGIADANKIIWTPKMPYTEKCAIGYTDGAELTHLLTLRSNKVTAKTGSLRFGSMLNEVQRHSGAYVPSLGELVRLYYMIKQRKAELPGLSPLEGEYLTSNENGSQYYMIDFSTGIIASSLSKQYGAAQLRLFYHF